MCLNRTGKYDKDEKFLNNLRVQFIIKKKQAGIICSGLLNVTKLLKNVAICICVRYNREQM